MRSEQNTAFIALTTLLILCLVSVACKRAQQPEAMGALGVIEIERNPGNNPPSREAEGLRRADNRIDETAPVQQQPKDEKCPFTVDTFVRNQAGTNCDTYKAEIAGTSRRCVKDCDNKARLAEAVASARMTCAEFCKNKKCPGQRYQPPDKCAFSLCSDAKECDPNLCPKLNLCALLQGDSVWNCICVED